MIMSVILFPALGGKGTTVCFCSGNQGT